MKKKRWIRYIAAGSCAAVLSMGLSARTQVYGAAGSLDLYEQIVNTQGNTTTAAAKDDRYTSSVTSGGKNNVVMKPASGNKNSTTKTDSATGWTYDATDSKSGPGASTGTVEVVEETGSSGPRVEEVSLSETYHEEFGVYEEGISNTCFIYSNVANGGITDQAVTVDIPANVTYVMEKDGIEIPYSSGQSVGDRGSYILRLTVADQSAAFSEQTIYKAVFRFRIQEKLPQAVNKQEGSYMGGGSLNGGIPGFTERTETADETEKELLELELSELEKEEFDESNAKENAAAQEGIMGEDGTIDEEVLDTVINDYLGLDESGNLIDEDDSREIAEGSGLASRYDSDNGLYCSSLASGGKFYSDVPNGMITSNPVTLRVPEEEGVELLVYRNGEEYQYTPGESIESAGSYHVYPSQDSAEFTNLYGNGNRPVFHFRIVPPSVNDVGILNAPELCSIQSVALNGETVFQASPEENKKFYRLTRDGSYEIIMNTPAGNAYTYLARDTEAPRFSVTSEANRVLLSYYSSDTAGCRLWKNGEELETTGLLSQISGSGNYTIEVYDAAGNTSEASFQIKFQMNLAAIMAIVLLLLLIAALLLFFRRARKEVKVR
ncbi:MAG: hypothetical protein ACLUFH_11450 [Monoglobales bacterium]